MKIKGLRAVMFLCLFIPTGMFAQSWPITAESAERKITVFKPAIEAYRADAVEFRAAIAVNEGGSDVPTFGSIWGTAKLKNGNMAGRVNLWGSAVDDIRFPDGITAEQLNDLAAQIEDAINARQPEMLMEEIVASQKEGEKEKELSAGISHAPPKVYYSSEAALLVNIDGDPVLMETGSAGVEMVANTPFLMLKYQNLFYLGNGALWYKSARATNDFLPERNVPGAVISAANSLKTSDEEAAAEATGDFYPQVIVSTVPAELIQTSGSPAFSAIEGTSLLYVSNTEEQLLFDINRQVYYVLLSGRWYTSSKLDAEWSYIPASMLPADFASIPEGSEKDVVLANVAGTKASKEAVRDAMVPQAAAVDRSTATSEVMYDGLPEFESIQGTDLQMAVNSSNTVIVERNRYFLVDNGVWFAAESPDGPWYVSDYRPSQVILIPANSPAYNVKYVEIYHSTPSVVYVGYTSGYLSSYVTNSVVVYGTGHRYRPWRGRYYYPRPCTWGFGMVYNPWNGWSINISYGVGGYGWFGYGYPRHYYPSHYHYHRPGWWGPSVYRPPYCVPYSHCYGYTPARPRPIHYGHQVTRRPVANTYRRPANNIYAGSRRTGVVSTRPAVSPSRTAASRESYNYSSSARPERRPASGGSRQGATSTRPSTRPESSGAIRQGINSNTRPSTRPGTGQSGTTTRPSTTTQPSRNTNTRSATTQQGGAATRPSTSTGGRSSQSTGSTTRPSTRPEQGSGSRQQTVRPATNQQERNSRQSTQPVTQPGNQTVRPSSSQNETVRPATNQQERNSRQSAQPVTQPGNRNTGSSGRQQNSGSTGRQTSRQSTVSQTKSNSNQSRNSGSQRNSNENSRSGQRR